MSRTIFIGDIHGCLDELLELWKKLNIKSSDNVYQVGDLINKGPDSHGVIQFCIKNKIQSILGNHEIRLLDAYKSKKNTNLKDYDFETLEKLKSSDWNYIKNLPQYLHLKSKKIVIIHAGFLPNKPWQKQSKSITSKIQVIDKNGDAQKRSKEPNGIPWEKKWTGPPLVIYGHTPRLEIERNPWSIGLDTSCVYGHYLTAYILEEDQFTQVSAKKMYSYNKYVSPGAQVNQK